MPLKNDLRVTFMLDAIYLINPVTTFWSVTKIARGKALIFWHSKAFRLFGVKRANYLER